MTTEKHTNFHVLSSEMGLHKHNFSTSESIAEGLFMGLNNGLSPLRRK